MEFHAEKIVSIHAIGIGYSLAMSGRRAPTAATTVSIATTLSGVVDTFSEATSPNAPTSALIESITARDSARQTGSTAVAMLLSFADDQRSNSKNPSIKLSSALSLSRRMHRKNRLLAIAERCTLRGGRRALLRRDV